MPIISGYNNSFTGTLYLTYDASVSIGPSSKIGGVVNVASTNATFELQSGASLSSNSNHAVAGNFNDNSDLSFTSAIKSVLILAQNGGTFNKNYNANSNLDGLNLGVGSGKYVSILAGTATSNGTLSIKRPNTYSLLYQFTSSNATVLQFKDPSYISGSFNEIDYSTGINPVIIRPLYFLNSNNITSNLTGLKSGTYYVGSFESFLTSAYNAGLLTASENTLALIKAMSDTTPTLNKIMGARGYDDTSKSSWVVVNSVSSSYVNILF